MPAASRGPLGKHSGPGATSTPGTCSRAGPPSSVVCDVGEDVQRRDWLLSALGVLATLLVLGLAVVLCGR